MESRAWDAPPFFHLFLLHHFHWAAPALAWGHWAKTGPLGKETQGHLFFPRRPTGFPRQRGLKAILPVSQRPDQQKYHQGFQGYHLENWGTFSSVSHAVVLSDVRAMPGSDRLLLCTPTYKQRWLRMEIGVMSLSMICNHRWKVLPALLCTVSIIIPQKKNPISWERPSQRLLNVDQKKEDPNKNKNCRRAWGSDSFGVNPCIPWRRLWCCSSTQPPASCGWECMVQARISRGWCPNPVYRQVHLSDDISYFCKVGGRKWLLFPVKNDQKSFPFSNFHFTFFKYLDVFLWCLVAPIIMLFWTETCVSHSDAKFRAHPGNARTPPFTLSPSPVSTTQASSRFYPEVLTIPPDLLFVVKSSYYKTSWPPRG